MEIALSNTFYWVDYHPAMHVKGVVDFANNEIVCPFKGVDCIGFSGRSKTWDFSDIINRHWGQYQLAPVLANIMGDQFPSSHRNILG